MSNLVGILILLLSLAGGLVWGLKKDTGEIVELSTGKRIEEVDSSQMITEKDEPLFSDENSTQPKERLEFTAEETLYLNSQSLSRYDSDTLVLIGQVKPLRLGNDTLQASSIHISKGHSKNKRIYISYATRGEKFLGAVQILEVKKKYARLDNFFFDKNNVPHFDPQLVPEVIQTVVFRNFDINTIYENDNKLFLGGGTDDAEFKTPAVLEIIEMNNGQISKNPTTFRIDLPSYTVTSVIDVGDKVYAATGDRAGGIIELPSVKNLKKKNITHFQELPYRLYDLDDVRDLAFDKKNIYAVKGTDAGLWILDRKDSRSIGKLIALTGATIPESKSTIELTRNSIILALGDGGTQIIDKKTLHTKIIIPQAQHYKNDLNLSVTNAASGHSKELYVADGESGARVFRYDPEKKSFNQISKITFGDGKSVNEIKYFNGFLIMANGLDGVKIARLYRKDPSAIIEEAKYYNELGKKKKPN